MAKTTSGAPSQAIVTIRIDLLRSKPKIWRAIDVPVTITLETLHDIIQAAMGWYNCHLWEFQIGEARFGPKSVDVGGWDEAPRDAAKTRLDRLIGPGKTIIDYTYDFGDDWEHRLSITDLREAEPAIVYPHYIKGKGACPPEDCGGLHGFYDMMETLANPAHPNHAEIKEWIDEDYDPLIIDEARIRHHFTHIAASLAPRAARKKPGVG